MSLLLYIIGAVALLLGVITIGFGISIELSFGNSLIVAGTSAAAGGLIVIGLGSVVAQLQRIVEALGTRAPIRPSRMPEVFEAPGASHDASARVPFPPKPKSGMPSPPPVAAPAAGEKPAEDRFAAAPTLPNPDEPPVEVGEEVSLSPFEPPTPASAETAEGTRPAPPFSFVRPEKRQPEPELDHGWRLPPIPGRPKPASAPAPLMEEKPVPPPEPQTAHFDAMWPAAEPKPEKPVTTAFSGTESPAAPENEPKAEPEAEPKAAPEAKPEAAAKAEPAPAAGPAPAEITEPKAPTGEARAVAILKSGIVDGMGYTLYVDGSIEAELPQGTLRFSSINDLRNYLESNGES